MTIKERIFNYLKRREPARKKTFPHYENIRSVLVLYESDYQEKNTVIRDIRDTLLKQNMDVVTWGFLPNKKQIQSLILPQRRILSAADFHWWGTPKQEILTDLDRREYDLMIDLTQQTCVPLHYIALRARASFKTGRVLPLTNGIYDFMINMPDEDRSQATLFNQIIHYLMIIHSND